MSDHIAHLGICDDTFRLAALHPQIDPHFRTLFEQRREDAHMGAITRTADLWSAQVIVNARPDATPIDPLADRKLAFVLGSLTHRAADRLTKPITNCWRGDDSGGDANESKIMQDLLVFKEVYGGGDGPHAHPFAPALLAPSFTEAQANFEAIFRTLLRRALISMHTIAPDHDHIDPWLTAFLKGLQTFPKSLDLYALLNREWGMAKVKKYLLDKNFYRRDDALIRLARDMQRGSAVSADQVVAALAATDKTHSRYARALAKAVEYLLAAGELYRGRIELPEAQRRFDVGVPELSIQE